MGLSFGGNVFGRNTLYDNGFVNAALTNDVLSSSTLTIQQQGGAAGAITAIYDSDPTTSYTFVSCDTGTVFAKWDMGEQKTFKNIYGVFIVNKSDCGGGTQTTKILGSNNNTDWTELASFTHTTATATKSLLVTSPASYRYIKFEGTNSANTHTWQIASAWAVV